MNINEKGRAESGAAARREGASVAKGRGMSIPQLEPTVYRPTHAGQPLLLQCC